MYHCDACTKEQNRQQSREIAMPENVFALLTFRGTKETMKYHSYIYMTQSFIHEGY